MFLDRFLLCAQDYFSARIVGVIYSLDLVRQKFLEEAPKEFGIEIRNRANDKEDLHPCDCDQRVERIGNRQRVDEGKDKENADKTFEFFPVIVIAAGKPI